MKEGGERQEATSQWAEVMRGDTGERVMWKEWGRRDKLDRRGNRLVHEQQLVAKKKKKLAYRENIYACQKIKILTDGGDG